MEKEYCTDKKLMLKAFLTNDQWNEIYTTRSKLKPENIKISNNLIIPKYVEDHICMYFLAKNRIDLLKKHIIDLRYNAVGGLFVNKRP